MRFSWRMTSLFIAASYLILGAYYVRTQSQVDIRSERTPQSTCSIPFADVPNIPLFILVDRNPDVQKMCVFKNGQPASELPELSVSTGKNVAAYNPKNARFKPSCKITPVNPDGQTSSIDVRPHRLTKHWQSTQYSGANMYNTVFFAAGGKPAEKSGWAIHGIDQYLEKNLGRPASGGCIRVTKAHSKVISDLVHEAIGRKGFEDKTSAVTAENVQIKVIDTSKKEDQDRVTRRCEVENRVNWCMKGKLDTLYADATRSWNNGDEGQEASAKAAIPSRSSEAINHDSRQIKRTLQVGQDYPNYVTAPQNEQDFAAALTWLGTNKLNYEKIEVYKFRYKNGEPVAHTEPHKVFRKNILPKEFMAKLRAACVKQAGFLVDPINTFAPDKPYYKTAPTVAPAPTPRPTRAEAPRLVAPIEGPAPQLESCSNMAIIDSSGTPTCLQK